MLTVGVTLFMALLILGAFILVFVNRESEKILTAAIPLAVGVIAGLVLTFWFARPEPISSIFPVSFTYQVADKLPMALPYRPVPFQLYLIDELRQRDSKALEEYPEMGGGQVYHEFLQKTLVDWIASTHFGHWHMEPLRFEGGPGAGSQEQWGLMPDAKEEPTDILSVEALQKIFSKNRFASVHTGFGRLALPPDTTPTEASPDGRILFKNNHCEISIQTSFSQNIAGIGDYSQFFGSLPLMLQYSTVRYIVRIDATFNLLLAGHPKMRLIKQWVMGIVNGLQNNLDDRLIWRKVIDEYTLRQHLPHSIQDLPLQFGPLRAQAPVTK
jgi:hypothetical protein